MDYQVSEQTRLSQVTAEIFVTDGLDGALNIDRESFNYSHPHYIYIKKWLHAALKLLFNRLKGLAKEDFDREKANTSVAKASATVETALEVWRSRKGEDADPPAPAPFIASKPVPHWTDKLAPGDRPAATAVSIILEAYGLRQHITAAEEEALIRSILEATRG
jgi:hypothetical protein